MRPNRLYVPQTDTRSFDLRHEQAAYFANPWHFHPELELNYVVASTGTRFIGKNIERFEPGEIILLGKHLPHYWRNDPVYFQKGSPGRAEAIIVRFSADFVGRSFWDLPEARSIQRLLHGACSGLRLLEPLRTVIADRMHALLETSGFPQLLRLLDLLFTMAASEATAVVSPNYVPGQVLSKQSERMSRVMAYLLDQFTNPIPLAQVADLASMNPAAFCRFFKAQTGQTLMQFVTDLRLHYACDLLTRTDESITLISEQAGFESVSYFVQIFRQKRGQTPMSFRRSML